MAIKNFFLFLLVLIAFVCAHSRQVELEGVEIQHELIRDEPDIGRKSKVIKREAEGDIVYSRLRVTIMGPPILFTLKDIERVISGFYTLVDADRITLIEEDVEILNPNNEEGERDSTLFEPAFDELLNTTFTLEFTFRRVRKVATDTELLNFIRRAIIASGDSGISLFGNRILSLEKTITPRRMNYPDFEDGANVIPHISKNGSIKWIAIAIPTSLVILFAGCCVIFLKKRKRKSNFVIASNSFDNDERGIDNVSKARRISYFEDPMDHFGVLTPPPDEEKGLNLQEQTNKCLTDEATLMQSSEEGSYVSVTTLVDGGTSVNVSRPVTGEKPLHLAARCRDGDERGSIISEKLIQAGASCNDVDAEGSTALHEAASLGHCQTILVLLQYGTHIDAVDSTNTTALILAVRGGHFSSVEALLKNGADVSIEDHNRWRAMHWACATQEPEILDLLIQSMTQSAKVSSLQLAKDCNIDAVNEKKETALHLAAREGSTDCVRILLKYYATRRLLSNDRKTPEDMAKEHDHRSIVTMLNTYESISEKQKSSFNEGQLLLGYHQQPRQIHSHKTDKVLPPPRPEALVASVAPQDYHMNIAFMPFHEIHTSNSSCILNLDDVLSPNASIASNITSPYGGEKDSTTSMSEFSPNFGDCSTSTRSTLTESSIDYRSDFLMYRNDFLEQLKEEMEVLEKCNSYI